jgi:hypothetical protein
MMAAQADVDKDPAKEGDLYPIYEHGVGRWLAFDVPLKVQHKLETRGLSEYKLALTIHILVRDGKQAMVRFTFTEEGTFKPVLRPEMPETSHVDLVIGERNSVALPLTASSYGNFGGKRQTVTRFATVPLPTFQQMVKGRSLRGQLYWRFTDGEIVGQSEPRFFTLNEKALRTLRALDAKTRKESDG